MSEQFVVLYRAPDWPLPGWPQRPQWQWEVGGPYDDKEEAETWARALEGGQVMKLVPVDAVVVTVLATDGEDISDPDDRRQAVARPAKAPAAELRYHADSQREAFRAPSALA